MPQIKKLSPEEIGRIAAGEVVERPASIVKELIENSIDAGATRISIFIEESGKKSIRIVDNGCGMTSQDARLCFEHHATSKLTTVHDLDQLKTLGFRGEALSSISAVSTVILITRTKSASFGTKIIREQTKIDAHEDTSCQTGTDISIQKLFHAIPARRKFLKADSTEWRQIVTLVHAFCLNYRAIDFTLFSNNKKILHCPVVATSKERIFQIKDRHCADALLDLQQVSNNKKSSFTITGLISNHQYYRYDRSNIFFFVNNRWIKNQHLGRSLLKGYLNVLPPARYPAAYIFITIDPKEVDINIHPRKEEVQFLHPRRIEVAIQQMVKNTLEKGLSQQIGTTLSPVTNDPREYDTVHNPPYHNNELMRPLNTTSTHYSANNTPTEPTIFPTLQQIHTHTELYDQNTPSNEASNAPIVATRNYRLIGQYKKTYLLLEKQDGLFLVDQHAAQERVLYEQFVKRFEIIPTVKLLFPSTVTLTKSAVATVEPHLPLIRKHGIGIELFNDTQFVITSTPVHTKQINFNELIHQLASWIAEYNVIDEQQFVKTLHERLHAQMACKAAVKAGDALSTEAMHQLLDSLNKVNNRFTCPHGRPTGWLLPVSEIEKKFKRRL